MVHTESWLKNTVSNSDVAINDYSSFKIDRSREEAWSYKKKSCFSVSLLHTVSVPSCFEFIALKVFLVPNDSVVVVDVYRPPSAVTSSINDLADILSGMLIVQ